MSVAHAIRQAAERLEETSGTARLDAELLMAHALGVSRSDMLLRHMRDAVPDSFDALVERRTTHEPVAYIRGVQEFYGGEFLVTPDTLIPRGDSETLIEAAREMFADRISPKTILDLGTGSGALLLSALSIWPNAKGIGVEASVDAILVAIKNAQRLANTPIGVVGDDVGTLPAPKPNKGLARFIQRDWTKPNWADDLGQFDLILCNPPYVEENAKLEPDVHDFEPASALFAGSEGLDDYRVLFLQLGKLLLPEGVAIFEIGASQSVQVSEIAGESGFSAQLRHDLAGRPRALICKVARAQ